MYSTTIIETSFPKAWERAIEFVLKSPMNLRFGGGKEEKHAIDSECQVLLDINAIKEISEFLVHPSEPFLTKDGKPSMDKINAYIKEYEKNYKGDFSYTYRHELEDTGFILPDGKPLDQITKLRDGLKKQIDENLPSNRNVAILYNPLKWDMSSSSPCWNEVSIRLERIDPDGTVWVSVHTLYRSHDLADAWCSNIVAQYYFIYNEILKPLNAKVLFWDEHNFSLHIYDYDIPHAKQIKSVGRNPALVSRQEKYDKISKGNK